MRSFYEKVIYPILQTKDVESTYDATITGLKYIGRIWPLWRAMIACNRVSNGHPIELFGLKFPNYVGLAAGFDKNADCWRGCEALGFGHIEIGTVTYEKYPGSPRPRLFCYPNHDILINRIGFASEGAFVVEQKLAREISQRPKTIPLGINIGKSKNVLIEDAASDYVASFRLLVDHADYLTINISSLTLQNLKNLPIKDIILPILSSLRDENKNRTKKLGCRPIPLLVKISPDLNFQEIDDVLEIIMSLEYSGIVVANASLNHHTKLKGINEIGSISGKTLNPIVLNLVKYIHKKTQWHLPIIGVGGIFNECSAGEMMDAGASLIQIHSGLFFKGPFLGKKLANALKWRLQEFYGQRRCCADEELV